jgi:hypothetical protein
VQIEYFLDGDWQPMRTALAALKERQTTIQSMPAPSIQTAATEVETELFDRRMQLDEISLRQEDLRDRERARRQQQLAIAASSRAAMPIGEQAYGCYTHLQIR